MCRIAQQKGCTMTSLRLLTCVLVLCLTTALAVPHQDQEVPTEPNNHHGPQHQQQHKARDDHVLHKAFTLKQLIAHFVTDTKSRAYFKAIDTNNDGEITQEECKELFDKLDSNGDGVLDTNEFVSPINEKASVIEKAMKFDEDGDGLFSLSELFEAYGHGKHNEGAEKPVETVKAEQKRRFRRSWTYRKRQEGETAPDAEKTTQPEAEKPKVEETIVPEVAQTTGTEAEKPKVEDTIVPEVAQTTGTEAEKPKVEETIVPEVAQTTGTEAEKPKAPEVEKPKVDETIVPDVAQTTEAKDENPKVPEVEKSIEPEVAKTAEAEVAKTEEAVVDSHAVQTIQDNEITQANDSRGPISVLETLKILQNQLHFTEADALFVAIDYNGDGKLTEREFKLFYFQLDSQIDDDKISEKEFQAELGKLNAILGFFLEIDADKSGQASGREILHAMVHKPIMRSIMEDEEHEEKREIGSEEGSTLNGLSYESAMGLVNQRLVETYNVTADDIMFEIFDMNMDDVIDKEEYVIGFKIKDENGDGVLTKEEIHAVYKHFSELVFEFLEGDLNKDGEISPREFLTRCLHEERQRLLRQNVDVSAPSIEKRGKVG